MQCAPLMEESGSTPTGVGPAGGMSASDDLVGARLRPKARRRHREEEMRRAMYDRSD